MEVQQKKAGEGGTRRRWPTQAAVRQRPSRCRACPPKRYQHGGHARQARAVALAKPAEVTVGREARRVRDEAPATDTRPRTGDWAAPPPACSTWTARASWSARAAEGLRSTFQEWGVWGRLDQTSEKSCVSVNTYLQRGLRFVTFRDRRYKNGCDPTAKLRYRDVE